VRAKRPQYAPVVLTREEVRLVLQRMDGVTRLMALLLYGAGLRLLESCRLRIKDVDFSTNQIVVRDGKGHKDRITMLSGAVKEPFAAHVEAVRRQHGAITFTSPSCSIRTLQELLGHRDVSKTMIDTHVLNRGPAAVRSPADRILW
jgi:site-specific recombinase XerD